MGICSSMDSIAVSSAKLILQDGQLVEFSYPVKVSQVLHKNPSCFICNSDEMDFDDVLYAMNDDERLLPGQLYFLLPISKLRHPLQPEEMAALAVKASSALMRNGGDGLKGLSTTRKDQLQSRRSKLRRSDSGITRSGGENKRTNIIKKNGATTTTSGRGRGRNFTSSLGAIPE